MAQQIRITARDIQEGDVVITAGAPYRVSSEPVYVRRGQLYVRVTLHAVSPGWHRLDGKVYDFLADEDMNRVVA